MTSDNEGKQISAKKFTQQATIRAIGISSTFVVERERNEISINSFTGRSIKAYAYKRIRMMGGKKVDDLTFAENKLLGIDFTNVHWEKAAELFNENSSEECREYQAWIASTRD